jgi:hypothetical protein
MNLWYSFIDKGTMTFIEKKVETPAYAPSTALEKQCNYV